MTTTLKERTPLQAKIVTILYNHGPIEDEDGLATSILLTMTGHHTTNALCGVLQTLEKRGDVVRQTAGRRTYRIALADGVHPDEPRPFAGPRRVIPMAMVETELQQLKRENIRLRQVIVNLSEALSAAS